LTDEARRGALAVGAKKLNRPTGARVRRRDFAGGLLSAIGAEKYPSPTKWFSWAIGRIK
jgi:hypothetical protein